MRSRQDELKDVSNVVWSEVTRLCGLWDGPRMRRRYADLDFHTDFGEGGIQFSQKVWADAGQ